MIDNRVEAFLVPNEVLKSKFLTVENCIYCNMVDFMLGSRI